MTEIKTHRKLVEQPATSDFLFYNEMRKKRIILPSVVLSVLLHVGMKQKLFLFLSMSSVDRDESHADRNHWSKDRGERGPAATGLVELVG